MISEPLIAPSRFRLSSHTEETSVKVEWDSFQCHESDGYVQKFLLFFCEAETLENCTGEKGLSEDLTFLFLHLSDLIIVNTMCHFYCGFISIYGQRSVDLYNHRIQTF